MAYRLRLNGAHQPSTIPQAKHSLPLPLT
jgi:hypothetical protein